jgi:biotin synthase
MATPMKQLITDVLYSVLNNTNIDYGVVSDLSKADGADLWDLFAAAGRVRGHFRGDTVDICSIVNAKSGACSEDCSYCAQSIYHNTGVKVYPLISFEQIAEAATSAKKNGAKRFCIVTSGRGIDSHNDLK